MRRGSLRVHMVVFSVIVGLVAGMHARTLAQVEPQEQSQGSTEQKQAEGTPSGKSGVEDAALTATSVLVSAGQVPLRAATCGATFVVAGLAYLLTVFDKEARQGPAGAIKRVCEGPYITTPEDLRGD
jgi:hypothetical protein